MNTETTYKPQEYDKATNAWYYCSDKSFDTPTEAQFSVDQSLLNNPSKQYRIVKIVKSIVW